MGSPTVPMRVVQLVDKLSKASAKTFSFSEITFKDIDLKMANTKALSKEDRKKSKRASRKKQAPKKPRDYPRGSKKPKVKKLARGTAKR